MKSIFNNYLLDFTFIVIFGFLFCCVPLNENHLIYIVVFALLDSGHAYSSILRTLFNKNERSRSSIYWSIPLAVFICSAIWFFLGGRAIWSFVFYLTVFHFIKQEIGILRWYNLKNKEIKKDRFFELNLFIPIIAFHFKPGATLTYYEFDYFLFFPNHYLYKATIIIYCVSLFIWVFKQRERYFSSSFVFSASRVILYALCFFQSSKLSIVDFIPLVASHGASYLYIMINSVKRTHPNFKPYKLYFFIPILIAIAAGYFEFFFENKFLDDLMSGEIHLSGIALSLYLVPLVSHYLWDGFIWKKSHPDSMKIYST